MVLLAPPFQALRIDERGYFWGYYTSQTLQNLTSMRASGDDSNDTLPPNRLHITSPCMAKPLKAPPAGLFCFRRSDRGISIRARLGRLPKGMKNRT